MFRQRLSHLSLGTIRILLHSGPDGRHNLPLAAVRRSNQSSHHAPSDVRGVTTFWFPAWDRDYGYGQKTHNLSA